MKNKLVITGSSSLQEKVLFRKDFWEKRDFEVLDYPEAIPKEDFNQKYPSVFRSYFENLNKTDILFIMNEDKKGIPGYIGAQTYAEICYCVTLNQAFGKNIEIILLKNPDSRVQSYEEINLWLELGWIRLFD